MASLDGFDGKILIISRVGPFLLTATGFQFLIFNLKMVAINCICNNR